MSYLINTKTGVKGPFSVAQIQTFVDKGQLQLAHKVQREGDSQSILVEEALAQGVSVPATAEEPAAMPQTRRRSRSSAGTGTQRKTRRTADENPYAAPSESGTRRRSRGSKGSSKYLFRPVKTVGFISMSCIAVCMLISLYTVFVNNEAISLLGTDFTEAQGYAIDDKMQQLGIIYLIGYIISCLVFFYLINQVCKNAHFLQRKQMSDSPAMAVGSFFIPFYNIYKPYAVLRDIFKSSGLRDKVGLLLVWWILWLLAGGIGRISAKQYMRADTVETIQAALSLENIGEYVTLAAGALVMAWIYMLTNKQHDLYNSRVEE